MTAWAVWVDYDFIIYIYIYFYLGHNLETNKKSIFWLILFSVCNKQTQFPLMRTSWTYAHNCESEDNWDKLQSMLPWFTSQHVPVISWNQCCLAYERCRCCQIRVSSGTNRTIVFVDEGPLRWIRHPLPHCDRLWVAVVHGSHFLTVAPIPKQKHVMSHRRTKQTLLGIELLAKPGLSLTTVRESQDFNKDWVDHHTNWPELHLRCLKGALYSPPVFLQHLTHDELVTFSYF